MKKTILLISVYLLTFAGFAQSNPYALFGYKPKVVYPETTQDAYRIKNSNLHDSVKFIEFDFGKKTIRLIGERDRTLRIITVTEEQLLRWTSVDPLAEKYAPYSPYAYVGNNPIRRTDPDGKEWEDPKDLKKAEQIDRQLQRRDERLQKQEQRLTSKIEKAIEKGKIDKVARFAGQRNEVGKSRGEIATSRSEIAAMGADKNKTFAFNELPQGLNSGFLSTKSNGTTVINYVSGSEANTVHELVHASQVQRNLMAGIPGTKSFQFTQNFKPIQAETEAYRRQFAFDKSSMPTSVSPTPGVLNDVRGDYIYGIFDTNAQGVRVFMYSDLITQ